MVVLFPMKASASWLHDEFANRKFATLCCFTCMGACLLPQRAWTTHAYGGRTRRAVVSKMGLVRRCMWSSSPRCFAKTGPVQRTNRDLLSRTTWQHTTNPVSQSHGQRGTFKPHFIASWTQPEGHAAAMRGSPATRVTESCCDVRGQLNCVQASHGRRFDALLDVGSSSFNSSPVVAACRAYIAALMKSRRVRCEQLRK